MRHTIKAIETFYNGYRFRSRTEARWAVFMDTLGVPYIYEKEGFDLGEVGLYLPDFWLPNQDCWLEIKPTKATKKEWEKAQALSKHTGKVVFIFYECSPVVDRMNNFYKMELPCNEGCCYAPNGSWNLLIQFGICPECNDVCIGMFGGHRTNCHGWEKDVDEFEAYNGKCKGKIPKNLHPRLIDAYTAARSTRFEHNEKWMADLIH